MGGNGKFMFNGYLRKNLTAKVALIIGTILIITVGVTFYIVEKRQERLIMSQVEAQARILFKQILLTRRWIADHGGIFVEKLPWVEKNLYLKDSEIVDVTGKRYIKENPALVTRQLSDYSKNEGIYWFHITSSKLLNPSNAPDGFEKKALVIFEKGEAGEVSAITQEQGFKYFRYVAPLYVESSCIECHRGYRIGDVRGAISVTIPLEGLLSKINSNRKDMILGTIIISILLLVTLISSIRAFVLKPISRLKNAMEAYSRGEEIQPFRETEDEIGSLYRTFNEMQKTIDEHRNSLKERVEEATSQLQRTNEMLMESSRLYRELSNRKSDFISFISHELRTPLTAIQGAIDYINAKTAILLNKGYSDEIKDIQQFLKVIDSNFERLKRMVKDSLNIEKIEQGRMEFHFECINIDRTIQDILLEVFPLLEKKRIRIQTEIDGEMLTYADEDRIKEVLCNLLANSIDHSPEGALIHIEGYRTGDRTVIRIEDEGPGVAPEVQKKIFEKFYKGRTGGTGLGLALCKLIIEQHGGELGVLSDGIKGSTFYFKLPAMVESDETQDTCHR